MSVAISWGAWGAWTAQLWKNGLRDMHQEHMIERGGGGPKTPKVLLLTKQPLFFFFCMTLIGIL